MDLNEITKILQDLKPIIRKYKGEIVGICGSYARDEHKESSDIDILVKFDKDASLFDLVAIANLIEDRIGIKVDIIPIDTIREEIRDEMLKEAIYL
ncbi:MAG: nucleotidyltransferase [Candidatus Nitrosocaldaceae archaeon]|nr:MAG: nucleotidyltransferase [Candidatus Nitrosocaldaceae archaeon]GIU72550.1 MAG: nucleotidyltransferase [Candidatus Nitrosocaldaceae archaeon]